MKAKNSQPIMNHLVIIPDGNRRWAKKNNLPSWRGHEEGSKRLEELGKEALSLKIPYFTFWIASKDNLNKRSKSEVQFLYRLFTKGFKELINNKTLHDNKVRVRVLGFWQEIVPLKLKKSIDALLEKTKAYKRFNLTFLLGYDGIEEMLHAIKTLASRRPPAKIDYNTLKKSLITSDLPPVDYIIRTGGEPHNSAGFMMWHSAYSQYYFTPTFFPAFGKKELRKALEDFYKRKRRYGA